MAKLKPKLVDMQGKRGLDLLRRNVGALHSGLILYVVSLCGHTSSVESVTFDSIEVLILSGAWSGVIKFGIWKKQRRLELQSLQICSHVQSYLILHHDDFVCLFSLCNNVVSQACEVFEFMAQGLKELKVVLRIGEENDREPLSNKSGGEDGHNKENNKEKSLWVPKTWRIDDSKAAKSSIRATLGIKNDKANSVPGGTLFKSFPSKHDENMIMQASPVLQASPAALSRAPKIDMLDLESLFLAEVFSSPAKNTKICTDKRFVGARTLDFEVIVASSYLSRRGPCPNSRGTKIGATLWQELFPEFEPKLRCGGAYVIQNVKVVDTHSDYKVSAIKYLVYFVKTTSVKEVDRPEIPPNVHAITSFADIISGVAKPDTLLDDAIEQNHFVQKPLVVMLTLAKIKEPKAQSTQYCQDKFLHDAQIVSFGEIKTLRQDEQCISNKSAAVGAASSSQQDYHPTPSLSQSSEYDPGNVAFVTPAKRTSDQQGSSQFDSDDFTTYELSTNKHIKAKPNQLLWEVIARKQTVWDEDEDDSP
ncbi:hypothetical protein JHK86_035042 [Glycine max]|nr:hypothetical protein JHK86_035042 [Glycine max]